MSTIIDFLLDVETKAHVFYSVAADQFTGDVRLSSFLRQLAAEEQWHYTVMQKISSMIDAGEHIPAAAVLDAPSQEMIDARLCDCTERARSGSLSAVDLAETIVAVECSEWNSLFFHVVNSLKDRDPEFKRAAIGVQSHLKFISTFLDTLEINGGLTKQIRSLPPLWCDRILVVDDDEAVRSMLTSVLRNDGIVDTAHDGESGLRRIEQEYYSVIISDIRMPSMDGIELFRKASERFANIGERFLFFSTAPSEDQKAFFSANKLRFLEKPVRLREIRENVSSILQRHAIPIH